MELKSPNRIGGSLKFKSSSNRTFMELKYPFPTQGNQFLDGSNRTFMELK